MTANGGQKGRGGRNPRTSARLSLGPEDDWRSWSKLPAGSGAATEPDADEDEAPIEQLEGRLRGSMMMVVAPADGAATPELATTPEPAPEPAPVAETPPGSLPRRTKADLPPPAEVVTSEVPVVADLAAIDGDAALAAAMPEVEEGFATPTPIRPPAGPSAVPAARSANHPAAGGTRSRPTPPPAPPAPTATPAPAAAPAPSPVARRDVPSVGQPYGDPRRAKKAAGDEIAIVLVSDPALEETPAARPAPARARSKPPRPAVTRDARPPAPVVGAPTASGLMAEAVSLLEERVTRQAEEIESLLEDLETRYDDELARLDGRVHEELSSLGRGVPKEFEDRVHAGFMQLVERLERLESGRSAAPPAAAPVTPPAAVAARADLAGAADAAAIAVALEGQARLAASVDEVAQQHITLAETQQLVATEHRQMAGQLEATLAQVAELSRQVEQLVAVIPAADRRLAGLEQQTAAQLALFQARIDDLGERFPAVEGAVEVATRNTDAIAELRNTMDQFRAALDHEVSSVHQRLDEVNAMRSEVSALQERSAGFATEFAELTGRLDATDDKAAQIEATASELNADFLRLQAETDRRSSAAEARVLDLEDAIGGEVGVERNLLLDRIEEMERGLYELDPDRFVRRDEVPGLGPIPDRRPADPGH